MTIGLCAARCSFAFSLTHAIPCHAMRCMYIYKAFKQFSIDNYSFNKSAKAVKFFVYCCYRFYLSHWTFFCLFYALFLCFYLNIKIKNANLSLFTSFHIIEIELFAWWFYYENSIQRNWIWEAIICAGRTHLQQTLCFIVS